MDTTQLLSGDVMTIDPVVVHPDATLEEGVRLLSCYSITGLTLYVAD